MRRLSCLYGDSRSKKSRGFNDAQTVRPIISLYNSNTSWNLWDIVSILILLLRGECLLYMFQRMLFVRVSITYKERVEWTCRNAWIPDYSSCEQKGELLNLSVSGVREALFYVIRVWIWFLCQDRPIHSFYQASASLSVPVTPSLYKCCSGRSSPRLYISIIQKKDGPFDLKIFSISSRKLYKAHSDCGLDWRTATCEG